MSKKPKRIDGIRPRNSRPTIDNISASPRQGNKRQQRLDDFQVEEHLEPAQELHESEVDFEISFDDLDGEEKELIQHKKSWWRRSKKEKKEKSRLRKFIKRSLLTVSFGVLAFGGFIGVKAFLAANNIIDRTGNCPVILCDSANAAALQGEGDGRVNILLVGIGGEGHDGGDLADTIIVASIDPIAKEAAMLSVPRDLYVDIPGFESTRINAAHAYGEQYGYTNTGYPEGGIGLLQETIEETLDIPVHYYLRVDFQAFRQAVDEVGGVDVKLEEALYDPTFWWETGILDLEAGMHTLNGDDALSFVRSRKTSARGDFARGDRQRDVILSLKDKVLSLNTFSDPRKIIGLIDTFGSNVRTNIQIGEMARLYEISQEITSDKIVSSSLGDENANFLASTSIGGASVLVPAVGDFSEIQSYVRSIFTDGFIKSEQAQIMVLNGAGVPALATETSDELASYGYSVAIIDAAPTDDYDNTVLFDVSAGDKPFTKQLLEQRFGSEMRKDSFLPEGIIVEGIDFVVIVGQDRVQ